MWVGSVFPSNLVTREQAVSKAFLSTGDTLLQALDFLPLLMQTVEKAASQNTQVPMATEGVAAALLLSKLSVADSQAGKGLRVSRVPGGRFFSGSLGLVRAVQHHPVGPRVACCL